MNNSNNDDRKKLNDTEIFADTSAHSEQDMFHSDDETNIQAHAPFVSEEEFASLSDSAPNIQKDTTATSHSMIDSDSSADGLRENRAQKTAKEKDPPADEEAHTFISTEDEVAKFKSQVAERIDEEKDEAKESFSKPPAERKFNDDFILQCSLARDKGNGILFSQLFYKHFACLGKDYWLKFNTHSWEEVDTSYVQHAVEKVADTYLKLKIELAKKLNEFEESDTESGEKSRLKFQIKTLNSSINRLHTMSGVNDCLSFSRANEKTTMISGDMLDTNPYILCCNNGVVDIRSGVLHRGYPDDYITKTCNGDWDNLDTQAPTWERIIHQILGENIEVTNYFHKLIGMAVCGVVSEKIFIILLGEDGNSGKTTIFEILLGILKKYVSPMPVEMLLDQKIPKNPDAPTPSTMSLKGKRICWASEPGENRRFSVESIKLMSGADSLTGRNPWDKDMSSFTPTHTLFLLTNHKMRASAHDEAFWSRLRLIECPFNFVSHPDPNNKKQRPREEGLHKKIIEEEASGVLAWIVRGYMKYQLEGIEPPEAVKKFTSQYRREEDIMAEFIEQCLEENSGEKIGGAELYEIFSNWFKVNYSKNVMSGTSFGRMASKHLEKRKVGGKVFYLGHEITAEAKKNYDKF